MLNILLKKSVLMELTHLAQALRYCGRHLSSKHGKSLHSHVLKLGHSNHVFIVNNLIYMYASDVTLLCDAEDLFDEMPHRNVVTWTTLISAYTTAGYPNGALRIFNRMLETTPLQYIQPNSFTFSAALKACALTGNLELGKLIHAKAISYLDASDTVLMNTLVDMYVKCGALSDARHVFNVNLSPNLNSWNTMIAGYTKGSQMEEALKLFGRMPQPDIVSWNTLIAGFVLNNETTRALEFVNMMHHKSVKLDDFTFSCVLKSCFSVNLGKQMHCYVVKSGFFSSCYTVSSFVGMYANCGRMEEARNLFDEYFSCKRSSTTLHDNLAIWNSLLSGYVVNELNVAALDLTLHIHRSSAPLNCYTFSSALKACINMLNWRVGLQIHGLTVTSGYELNYVVGSVIVDFYMKHGNIKKALALFWRLPKDIVAWTGMITACCQIGSNLLAFSLFKDMVFLDCEKDQFLLTNVLKACSNLAWLVGGKQVHAYCVKTGFDAEEILVTALIDIYSKSGEIEDALTLFSGVTERDIVLWTDVIVGCGKNGRAREAIRFFEEVLCSMAKPNKITYLGVLDACRHAGLVEEALVLFRCMKEEHGLEPGLEHFCCMIDLFGRAGLFDEAEKLIAAMPCEPNEAIWGSLLSACTSHCNAKLGTRIAKKLVDVSPINMSISVSISNFYANLGMWDNLQKLREKGKKETGESWIEVR